MDALLKVGVIIEVVVFRTRCCVVARIALATDCCCWWSKHRVRRQLIDDSITKCRDLLENVIPCSPGINRWYRVIRIFLTRSPGNRRYSSIIKNRDLPHKYLVVPITTHTHVRRKSIGKKKIIEKTEEKGFYIPIQYHPVSSRSRRPLLLSIVEIYIWLLVCRDMATWPLFLCPECLYRDALGNNCIDSSWGWAFGTNCGRIAIFCPTRVVYGRKPAKILY